MPSPASRATWPFLACALLGASILQPVAGRAAPGPAAPGPATPGAGFDAPTAAWREGPARYVLSQDEDKAFRRLESDAARAEFIRRFWSSHDPDPTTPENEFRDSFYHRVDDASRLFTTESTKPGWKTDRGKIFILLGPPDEFDLDTIRETTPDLLTWTYRQAPPGTLASPNTQVRFIRDASGEYRLTTGVRIFRSDSAMTNALSLQALQVKSLPDRRMAPGAAGPAPPPSASVGRASQVDFFRAGNGRTLVVFTVWLDPAQIAGDPDVYLRPIAIAPGDPPAGSGSEVATLRLARGGPGDAADPALPFQGGAVVRPGAYALEMTLSTGPGPPSLSREISVPALRDDTLAVGAIAFARRIERLHVTPWLTYTAPFLLGALRAVPRDRPAFHAGEEFGFYFQVLGGSLDPIEGLPDLDLEYSFKVRTTGADGVPSLQAFGHPIHLTNEQSLMQGFSLPLTGWAAGDYVLEVVATDNLTGGTARGEATFHVD